MKGKLKMLGLAAVAILMLGVTMAPAVTASTHEVELEEGSETAVLTGSTHIGKDTFAVNTTFIGLASFECNGTYSATVEDEANAVSVRPSESECSGIMSGSELRANHCSFVLSGSTDQNGDTPVEVACNGEDSMEFALSGWECTWTIGPSAKIAGGFHYTDVRTGSNPGEVTMHATLNVAFSGKDGVGCQLFGNAITMDATITVKGFKDLGDAGSEGTPVYDEGSQIDVQMAPGT